MKPAKAPKFKLVKFQVWSGHGEKLFVVKLSKGWCTCITDKGLLVGEVVGKDDFGNQVIPGYKYEYVCTLPPAWTKLK